MATMFTVLLNHLDDLEQECFKRFKTLLHHEVPDGFETVQGNLSELDRTDTVTRLIGKYGSDGSRIVMQHIMKILRRNDLCESLEEKSKNASKSEEQWEKSQREHKVLLKTKCAVVHQGVRDNVQLDEMYTELCVFEGVSEGFTAEHEVVLVEQANTAPSSRGLVVTSAEMFNSQDRPKIKTVLTIGIAGVGKTITARKFVLDWVEGKIHQDIRFIFILPFRELNLMKLNSQKRSMRDLLSIFHPEVKDVDLEDHSVLFIFDGLDESKHPLNFASNEVVNELDAASTVDQLLTNLIKGHLFHRARIWITSRPATADKIPQQLVDRFTEIKGFDDSQKDEYFRKAVGEDQELAVRLIAHIKSCPSLHIMCYLPIFCWISFRVLRAMMKKGTSEGQTEIPRTITNMYVHFLLVQTSEKNRKYNVEETNQRNRKKLSAVDQNLLLTLGKLAYKHLESGTILFDEEDMTDYGVDVETASVCSGMCTEIIRVDCGLYDEKMYCFVHLSIQELFAALYVFSVFVKTNRNLLIPEERIRTACRLSPNYPITYGKKEEMDDEDHVYFPCVSSLEHIIPTTKFGKKVKKGTEYCSIMSCNVFTPLSSLHKTAVDLSLASERGHLDLFVRFLLGVSLSPNQDLLQSLLTPVEGTPGSLDHLQDNIAETIAYLNRKLNDENRPGSARKENGNPQRLINMIHCLNELNDDKLQREVNARGGRLEELTAPQCSALAYTLTVSNEPFDVFDLKAHNAKPEGHTRLMPCVKKYKTVLLDCCRITLKIFQLLGAALKAENHIRELDLSDNSICNEAMTEICDGFKHKNCKLETLRVERCLLSMKACECLGSVFGSSRIKRMSVAHNDLQDSGAEILLSGLVSSSCSLQSLSMEGCGLTGAVCVAVASVLKSSHSQLKELDLSSNHLGDSGVQLLCEQLGGASGTVRTLRLGECDLTEACCADLARTLCSSCSDMTYLDLMHNKIGDSGVKMLCEALGDPHCKLQKLGLSDCDVTKVGCSFLVAALRLNSGHLVELDLGHEDSDDPEVQLFTPLSKELGVTLKLGLQNGETKRATLLKYTCPLSFDDASSRFRLSFSQDLLSVSQGERICGESGHVQGRFAHPQVLCRESLIGRCYWEVDWRGQACQVGLMRQGSQRVGESEECVMGRAPGSWSLMCHLNSYQAFHEEQMSNIVLVSGSSRRVGVFLDSEEGRLLFYDVVKDTARPLHSFNGVDAAERLVPAVFLGPHTTVSLRRPAK